MAKLKLVKPARPLPPAVLMRCGCELAFTDGEALRCPSHGDVGIARTVRMPAPRIRGVASGPHVQTEDLAPFTGRIAGGDKKQESAGQ